MDKLYEIDRIKEKFNFEALNTIYQIAYFEGAGETLDLLESYIDMFRSCTCDVDLEMVKCEVSRVKSYLKIQKVMRNDRLKHSLFLSHDVMDKYIKKDKLYMATHIIVESLMNKLSSNVFLDINISKIGDLDNIFFSINVYHSDDISDQDIEEVTKDINRKMSTINEFEEYSIDTTTKKEIFFKFIIPTE